jgi:hypothetical protein
MADYKKLSISDVKGYISYDPESGIFLRLRTGKRADTKMTIGYNRVRITIGGCQYEILAHRLAWFMHHGCWPPEEIDHINGDRSDNAIKNLRAASRSENAKNLKRRDNQSGVLGVRRHQAGWKVMIAGKYLGYKPCFWEAVNMRKSAEILLGYHKNHGRA